MGRQGRMVPQPIVHHSQPSSTFLPLPSPPPPSSPRSPWFPVFLFSATSADAEAESACPGCCRRRLPLPRPLKSGEVYRLPPSSPPPSQPALPASLFCLCFW